jgi:hypothetical protein
VRTLFTPIVLRVLIMKAVHADQTDCFRTPVGFTHRRSRSADHLEESTIADVVLIIVVVAAIFALYAAMFAGLYRWSHYDALIPPDTATIAHTDIRTAA